MYIHIYIYTVNLSVYTLLPLFFDKCAEKVFFNIFNYGFTLPKKSYFYYFFNLLRSLGCITRHMVNFMRVLMHVYMDKAKYSPRLCDPPPLMSWG